MRTFELAQSGYSQSGGFAAAAGTRRFAGTRSPAVGVVVLCSITCAGVLFCLLSVPLAYSSCVGPPSLRARLQKEPTAEVYADLGAWFGNHKQFKCAAEAFAAASKLQPDSASLAYMWGLSLYSAGDAQAAADPLRTAERLNPSDVRPYLALGAALDQASQFADAEKEWRGALAIDPSAPAALDGLSRDLINDKDYTSVIALLELPANRAQRSPQQSLGLGMAYAKTAQLDKASMVLREGLNTTPDSLPLANELAVVLVLLARTDEAIAVLDLAIEKHPRNLDTQILYFRTLVTTHSDMAQRVGHKLLSTFSPNWEVLYLNGVLETRDAEWQQARQHLEQSVALKPDYYKSRKSLGVVLAKLKDPQGARKQLEQAIALGDTEPETQYDLAMVLKGLGEVEQAKERIKAYQQLKEAQAARTQAAGKAQMGDQAMAAGDPAHAAALYREAMESDPGEALLAYKLAMALDKSNETLNEIAALQQALHLNPNLAEAQNQMGYLAIRRGETAQAEDCFRAAVHASPSYVVAWVNLAAALASEKRWQDARDAVGHALDIAPDNPQARQLSEAIAAAQAQP